MERIDSAERWKYKKRILVLNDDDNYEYLSLKLFFEVIERDRKEKKKKDD